MELLALVVLVYLPILKILHLVGNHGLVLRISKIKNVMDTFVTIPLTNAYLLDLLGVVFLWNNVNKLVSLPLMNVIPQPTNVTKYLLDMVLIYLIVKDNVLLPLLELPEPLALLALPVPLVATIQLVTLLLNNKIMLVIQFHLLVCNPQAVLPRMLV
jgi:hypothetical protein